MTTTQESSKVRELEDQRYGAMLGNDLVTLCRLLHEDLTYIHSSGATDSKATYLEGLKTGVWKYENIQRCKESIELHGPVALVFNQLNMEMVSSGKPVALATSTLAVWLCQSDGWRLLAVHSAAKESVGP